MVLPGCHRGKFYYQNLRKWHCAYVNMVEEKSILLIIDKGYSYVCKETSVTSVSAPESFHSIN